MTLQMTTEMLFSKLNEEKNRGELAPLQKEFYSAASEFIKSLESDLNGQQNARQAENTKRLVESLKEKRRQKLLIYLAYEKPLPQPVPQEEEDLYNEIRKIMNRDGDGRRIATVKILADVPEVLTSEGRKVGPYKQGDVIEVPNSADVEFMVKNKIGELATR